MTKTPDPTISLLRRVPAFDALDDRSLARLAKLVDRADVDAGKALAHEGEHGRQAFIIVEGHGQVTIDGEAVAQVGPGDFVGEMGMLDGRPRCATVLAETPMRLLVIGPEAFGDVMNDPVVARIMAGQLAGRLRRAETSTAS